MEVSVLSVLVSRQVFVISPSSALPLLSVIWGKEHHGKESVGGGALFLWREASGANGKSRKGGKGVFGAHHCWLTRWTWCLRSARERPIAVLPWSCSHGLHWDALHGDTVVLAETLRRYYVTHFQMLAVIKTMGKCYLLSFGELVFKLNINLGCLFWDFPLLFSALNLTNFWILIWNSVIQWAFDAQGRGQVWDHSGT